MGIVFAVGSRKLWCNYCCSHLVIGVVGERLDTRAELLFETVSTLLQWFFKSLEAML